MMPELTLPRARRARAGLGIVNWWEDFDDETRNDAVVRDRGDTV
jgi:hypothetical protein